MTDDRCPLSGVSTTATAFLAALMALQLCPSPATYSSLRHQPPCDHEVEVPAEDGRAEGTLVADDLTPTLTT